MGGKRFILAAALIAEVAAPAACGPARAEPPFPSGIYGYVVVDQDLRDVLKQFGANTGLRVALSDKVQGRVHGPLPSVPPRQYLSDLAQQFGLDWTYDGSTISVSSISEAQTELIPLQAVPFEKLRDGLAGAGLLDARYQFRPAMGGTIALVSGPPRYVGLVRDGLAAMLAEKPPAPKPAAAAPAAPSPPPPPAKAMTVMRGGATSRLEFK